MKANKKKKNQSIAKKTKRAVIIAVSLTLVIVIAAATVLIIALCRGGDENPNRNISVGGINLSLPEYMKRTASADGVCYKNKEDGARVCVLYCAPDYVVESLTDSSTAEDYLNIMVDRNRFVDPVIDYDSASEKATLTYTDAAGEKYHYELVIKSNGIFHHVEMDCDVQLADKYEGEFENWANTVKPSPAKLESYSESGLNFALPSYMKKLSVNYADICYGNLTDGVQFFVYFYSKDSLLTEMYISKDATVKEYADRFVSMNSYTNVVENYDEAAKKIILNYVYESERTYYCDFIMRNDDALFHVTMCCDEKMRDKYEPIFAEWMSNISLVY